jgi:4-hydroxybenzoate polyprenyltransferase
VTYIRLIRPYNLLIVLISQAILQYFIIIPLSDGPIVLSGLLFPLFVLDTLIVAAAGYIINDLKDYKSDLINKPNKSYIPHPVSFKAARIYYRILVIAGFVIALFLAIRTQNIKHIWIYPAATLFLYVYAVKLKSTVLWGNILVSVFIAAVTGILFFAQFTSGTDFLHKASLLEICLVYMVFSFLVNLFREIIKDLEDVRGDKSHQVVTLPVIYGMQKTKYLGFLIIAVQIILIMCWAFMSGITENFSIRIFLTLFVAAPMAALIVKLYKAKTSEDFGTVSKMTKLIMLAGLLSIFLIARELAG